MAKERGSTYFDLDNYNDVVNSVGEKNVWNINKKFLEQQIKQGKSFYLTHDPSKATGYFAKEVEFLKSKGYTFVKTGKGWKAIKK